jgi:hypothetical protein
VHWYLLDVCRNILLHWLLATNNLQLQAILVTLKFPSLPRFARKIELTWGSGGISSDGDGDGDGDVAMGTRAQTASPIRFCSAGNITGFTGMVLRWGRTRNRDEGEPGTGMRGTRNRDEGEVRKRFQLCLKITCSGVFALQNNVRNFGKLMKVWSKAYFLFRYSVMSLVDFTWYSILNCRAGELWSGLRHHCYSL